MTSDVLESPAAQTAPSDWKAVYEQLNADGRPYGSLGPRDYARFAKVLRRVRHDAASILDVGCCCGEWLGYVKGRRPAQFSRMLGIDIAENKVAEARSVHPDIEFAAVSADRLDLAPGAFDVATCLEVLEHIPDWRPVLDAMFRMARKQVLVTVPYRDHLIHTVCIHCAKLTPLYGHLHSFSEASFPAVPEWQLRLGRVRIWEPGRSLPIRLYKRLKSGWLVADYRRR